MLQALFELTYMNMSLDILHIPAVQLYYAFYSPYNIFESVSSTWQRRKPKLSTINNSNLTFFPSASLYPYCSIFISFLQEIHCLV